MRSFRHKRVRTFGQQVLFRSQEVVCSGGFFSGPLPWPHALRPNCPRGFPPVGFSGFQPAIPQRLALVYPGSRTPANRLNIQPSRKNIRQPIRPYFRPRKGQPNSSKTKGTLNPSDPLNLRDLVKETERRRVEGLSPLRGDSRLNTPALSSSGDMGTNSPILQPSPSFTNTGAPLDNSLSKLRRMYSPNGPQFTRRHPFRRNRQRQLPLTGNYGNYYNRRDPNDRLPYLMPEWFNGKDVADYGCHNGTLTFGILERFPDIRHIDAFDCDADLIATARNMQRERLRWNTGPGVRYEKINFQVGNWVDQVTPTEDPEYDTIVAFSVTKWIHLNHGDAGLLRFFRRAFNLLKPGGHLIIEPQPKSSYRRTRFTTRQRTTFQSLKIDPAKLEPLLADLGFSYFDTIKFPRPNEPFRRKIILCSKSYGATPASIRNDFRSEVQCWSFSPSPQPVGVREPPPVCYNPQTPCYNCTPIAINESSPALNLQQAYSQSSTTPIPAIVFTTSTTEDKAESVEESCEPDSTSV